MFKPNNFTESHPGLSGGLTFAAILFTCLCLMLSPVIGSFFITTSPYLSTCVELERYISDATATYNGKILYSDCIEYLEDNPASTRQDVMDHFEIRTWDDLLSEPIVVQHMDSNI